MIELPCIETVQQARERLGRDVHKTPVLRSRTLNKLVGAELFFKCENLQRTGSFKIRGALNAARAFVEAVNGDTTNADTALEPLVTHSSGNHGAALALAGKEVGREVIVVVPETAPEAKKANILRYGAKVVLCGPTIRDREQALDEVILSLIHI